MGGAGWRGGEFIEEAGTTPAVLLATQPWPSLTIEECAGLRVGSRARGPALPSTGKRVRGYSQQDREKALP